MFKFSLESLLRLNEQFEEQAKNKLGEATKRLNQEISAYESLNQELNALYDGLRKTSSLDSAGLQHFHNYSRLLNMNRVQQLLVVEKLRQEAGLAKAELIARKQEVQKLVRLKEKGRLKYDLLERRTEQKNLDEIALGQFVRQNMSQRRESL